MNTTSLPYRIASTITVPLVPWILRDAHQRESHIARLENVDRLVAWGKQRDQTRPLVWFHASSVGEGLQAETVMRAFRVRHPEALILFSHYSPSATSLASRLQTDWSGYLPYDRRRDVIPILDALRPDLLVFTKSDVWPELATQAAQRGTAVALVAGTVEPGSTRLRWPAKWFARPGYQCLSTVGAISGNDATRLIELGCPADRITVTGDPRIDAVLQRASQPQPNILWPEYAADLTLIAGSTWPDDDAILLEAFTSVLGTHPNANLIIVPHEPNKNHLDGIMSLAKTSQLPLPILHSAIGDINKRYPIVVVDRVGVLADLYQRAGWAYVGGGFGTKGIHSVLEPAAFARPVIIGPNDRGSRDAALLSSVGALTRLPREDASVALTTQWKQWLDHPGEMREAGRKGRNVLENERGASERSVDLLEKTMVESGDRESRVESRESRKT